MVIIMSIECKGGIFVPDVTSSYQSSTVYPCRWAVNIRDQDLLNKYVVSTHYSKEKKGYPFIHTKRVQASIFIHKIAH